MASLACASTCKICLTFIISFLAAQQAASHRVSTANHVQDDSTDPNAGAGCVKLENMNREELMTSIPPEVQLTLERRNLMSEYEDLTNALYDARQGTFGAWKCSELSKTMYILGHEEAFEAKNVSIYITKTGQSLGSEIHICFVDRVEEPNFMPPDIYTDAKRLNFNKGKGCKSHPDACSQLGQLPKGVYGQIYDSKDGIQSDKKLMPVDLLKFLEEKSAFYENMDMAALINTFDQNGFSAARIVNNFKKRFHAKGIKIFYAQVGYQYNCLGRYVVNTKICTDWYRWIEYADIAVVGEHYVPKIAEVEVQYTEKFITWYEECKRGFSRNLVNYIVDLSRNQNNWSCGDVAGATGNSRPSPQCKCKGKNENVFCGDQLAAGRKFDTDAVLSLDICIKQQPYCSLKPCLPPDAPM